MTEGELNLKLLQTMDANRRFLLLAMQSNPALLATAGDMLQSLVKCFGGPASPELPSPSARRA